MRVSILNAKKQLARLIKLAKAGETAKRGEPDNVATEAGNGRAILEWLKGHSLPDHARRSAQEIDAAIAAEREAWRQRNIEPGRPRR